MGSLTIILSVCAVFIVFSVTEAASGNCPLPSKVYSCSPKCQQDYECTHGKVCCPNGCNTKSCSQPAAGGTGSGGSSKYSSSGAGIYCDNVKCNAYEVCKLDPTTKRNKCSRA
ncbi:waprin-like protein [Plodia interpunctella]|uniref:waprin-like protein n=1 Tax=Plodia interpunctella TaxID=58824 RepID=UPI002368DAE5|nr:waprin-Thr1-like isoform X1 [Plodia interpunctella]XP_053618207.1 waprin-Thr1-like isoform X2 [Plodia interpunctella]XP_053618208.1 waprin-Thr1-like isoform X1 [Plodia interpunctella]